MSDNTSAPTLGSFAAKGAKGFFDGPGEQGQLKAAPTPTKNQISRGEEGLGYAPELRRLKYKGAFNGSHVGGDTTPGIFVERFVRKVPHLATFSDEHIRQVGLPSSGVKAHDRQIHNAMTQVQITINQMVEYHRKGVAVAICNPEDIPRIYDNIAKHLSAWRDHLVVSFNSNVAPVNDLLLLNDFALLIYSHVRKERIQMIKRDILSRVEDAGWYNMADVFAGKGVAAPKPNREEELSQIQKEMDNAKQEASQFQKDILKITQNHQQW